MDKLKRFRLKIDPSKGSKVDFISLVDKPAIERDFLKFAKEDKLKVTSNDDLMELFGPAAIPDMDIYRNSPTMGEYLVVFTRDDLKTIQMNFMESGYQHNVNLDHEKISAKSFVFETFQSSEIVPNPKGYEDLPLGTWYVRMKVNDPQVWDEIKSGKRNGFSIEGIFDYVVDEFEKQYLSSHTTNYSIDEKIITEKMIKKFLKGMFNEMANKMDEAPSEESTSTVEYKKVPSKDFTVTAREVGQKIQTTDAEGKVIDVPAGNYEFEDGFKFTVADDSTISKIEGEKPTTEETPVATNAQAMAEGDPVTTDTTTVNTVPSDELVKQLNDKVTQLESNLTYYNSRINDLETKVNTLSQFSEQIKSIPTKQELTESLEVIKSEFKLLFERALQIPGEATVSTNNKVKDKEQENFEKMIYSLRGDKK